MYSGTLLLYVCAYFTNYITNNRLSVSQFNKQAASSSAKWKLAK